MKKEKKQQDWGKKKKKARHFPLLWMQPVSCPGPCFADVEIASTLSFRKCSGMRRNERERQNWQNANGLQVFEWKWNEWQMRCFCSPYRNTVTEVTQIVWSTAANCCESSLASFLSFFPSLSSDCIWVSFLFLPLSLTIFFSPFHPSLPPSLPLITGTVFQNQISQITIFFRTAAWCFLHTRCYRSNRAIILPPAVSYGSCCMNLT